MFECSRRSLLLSESSCAADFSRVEQRGTQAWRSDWHCKNCAQGAIHAGRSVALVQTQVVAHSARQICVRCHRPADRFIGNRLCRSCDARDRELVKGRNSKGQFPTVLAARWHLHPVALRFIGALEAGWQWLSPVQRVSDLIEAVLTMVRREKRALRFSRPVPPVPMQLSFWGSC